MIDTAFVLLAEARHPDPAAVVATGAAWGLDIEFREQSETIQTYRVGDATLLSMLVDVPHPDAATMPYGPTSPPRDAAVAAPAHLIVTAMDLTGTERIRDLLMAILTAALIKNTAAVGAMLGHGILFHKADMFADLAAAGFEKETLPAEIAVDITVARESETHMSFLTHNLPRYDREDFYVTCPITGKGALPFVLGLVRWMLIDPDKHLPTGDTIGRTPDEKVLIQRVPNPADESATVIKLELT